MTWPRGPLTLGWGRRPSWCPHLPRLGCLRASTHNGDCCLVTHKNMTTWSDMYKYELTYVIGTWSIFEVWHYNVSLTAETTQYLQITLEMHACIGTWTMHLNIAHEISTHLLGSVLACREIILGTCTCWLEMWWPGALQGYIEQVMGLAGCVSRHIMMRMR